MEKIDINTQKNLIVAASTFGPRMFVAKLKQSNRHKKLNFMYDKNIVSRVRDFNDKMFLESMNYAWNYSSRTNSEDYIPEKIVYGVKKLQNLEQQLKKTYSEKDSISGKNNNWSLVSEDTKREVLVATAILGYDAFKKYNFNVIKLSKEDQKKIKDINATFKQYSQVSEYRSTMTAYTTKFY